MMDDEVWTIIVAGGSGRRYGAHKQFEPLGGSRVIDMTVEIAASVSQVVVVLPSDRLDEFIPGAARIVEGGVTRSDSVRAGLAVIPDSAEVILVHDGARPLATARLFASMIQAIRDGAEAAVPVVEISDSLRHRDGEPLDRTDVVAVQTPQSFEAEWLRGAHADGGEATDDATLAERAGAEVLLLAGEADNTKITFPRDLALAEAILRQRSAAATADARNVQDGAASAESATLDAVKGPS